MRGPELPFDESPQQDFIRTRYMVETAGAEHHVLSYSQFGWGPWDPDPKMDGPAVWPEQCSIKDVVDDLVAHWHDKFPAGHVDDDDLPECGDGINGRDLAIWQDARLLAVIRCGYDDEPVPTIFLNPPPPRIPFAS